MKAKPETPGPARPSPQQQIVERLAGVSATWQRMTDDLLAVRQHAARSGNAGTMGVRVMACLLTTTALLEQLMLLQIAVIGSEVE